MQNVTQELGAEKAEKEKRWYKRYLELTNHIAKWSLDPTTKVSAILVDSEYNVRALGYNGFPRGVDDNADRLNNRELKYPMTVHAEQNVISTCAKLGIRTEGCSLVCTHFPCSTCSGSIIQAGIKKIIVIKPNDDFISRWGNSIEISKIMLYEAGVEISEIDLTEED